MNDTSPINHCFCCPHKDNDRANHTSPTKILQYLSFTLEDTEGQKTLGRQLQLISHYLGFKRNVMNITEFPYLGVVLEFFSCNLKKTPQYFNPLVQLLSHCQRPAVINKTTDKEVGVVPVSTFFSSLASKFLRLGCVDYCLSRVPVSERLNSTETATKELTSNLLWALLRSKDSETRVTEGSQRISLSSLINLRQWFRRDIKYGKPHERNNIAALVLQVILFYPELEIVKSGILKDVCHLTVAWDFGTENTWATGVNFSFSDKDAILRKTLTTIVCYTLKYQSMCTSARECGFVTSLALLLELADQYALNSSLQQKKELLICSLHSLVIAAEYLPSDYMKSGATFRILNLIYYFSEKERNLQIVNTCCESLQSMAENKSLLAHFKELSVLTAMIDLIKQLLKNCKLTLLVQTILNYSCQLISDIIQSNKKLLQKYSDDLEYLSVNILKRLQNPDKFDSKIESSLLFGAGILVWNAVILNSTTKSIFISDNGIYMILDIMEEAPRAIQFLYLGILADSCFNKQCIPQIITWRGRKTNTNTISLLCHLWRTQENRKAVLRDEDYCIEDIEYPLMGKNQRQIGVRELTNSPALVEMIGCARPRIATVVNILTRSYHDHAQIARTVYLTPYEVIPTQDQITLEVIKSYEQLKEGEMFSEIQEALENMNAIFVPLDLLVNHNLIMRHIGCANSIQQKQRAILNIDVKKDLQQELKLHEDIRENIMIKTLYRLKLLHYYLKLSDSGYRRRVKTDTKKLLETLENHLAKEEYYHRTFPTTRDFTMIKSGRMPIIKSYISTKTKK